MFVTLLVQTMRLGNVCAHVRVRGVAVVADQTRTRVVVYIFVLIFITMFVLPLLSLFFSLL